MMRAYAYAYAYADLLPTPTATTYCYYPYHYVPPHPPPLPDQPRHWIAYLEFELEHQNYSQVQLLFTRCLRQILDVDLWKLYLTYIRRVNSNNDGGATPQARTTITEAYEFVLQSIGLDLDSTTIWQDYLAFIKGWPVRIRSSSSLGVWRSAWVRLL